MCHPLSFSPLGVLVQLGGFWRRFRPVGSLENFFGLFKGALECFHGSVPHLVRPLPRLFNKPLNCAPSVAQRQLRGFLRFRIRQPFKLEADGFIYILVEIPNWCLTLFNAHQMTAAEVLTYSAIKAGHTKDLKRRRREYEKCGGGHTTHIWVGSYKVSCRYFMGSFFIFFWPGF